MAERHPGWQSLPFPRRVALLEAVAEEEAAQLGPMSRAERLALLATARGRILRGGRA